MRSRFALALALSFGVLAAYLGSHNTASVRFALGSNWAYDLPLIALATAAFLLGAGIVLVSGTLRDLGRSYRDFQGARRARREETLKEIYHRGVDAQLAGRFAAATEEYEELLRRDPGYSEAHIRLGELARRRGDSQGALVHDLQALRAEERPETLVAAADGYHRAGRPDDAIAMYRLVLQRDRDHVTALRGLRGLAVELGRWAEALEAQERVVQLAAPEEQAEEQMWLAGVHYEAGRALAARGDVQAAIGSLREALRARADFAPAALALGDAHVRAGDSAQAARVWERAIESQPALPLLGRLEQLYRDEGRPTRMIALYQSATARAPDNLALAFGLGRVYFELAMLDEAADQFQKIEVRAPDLPAIRAHLGAIFERHGQVREACEEYRRALALAGSFEWPHRCAACGSTHAKWIDRCPSCHRWNTSRP